MLTIVVDSLIDQYEYIYVYIYIYIYIYIYLYIYIYIYLYIYIYNNMYIVHCTMYSVHSGNKIYYTLTIFLLITNNEQNTIYNISYVYKEFTVNRVDSYMFYNLFDKYKINYIM